MTYILNNSLDWAKIESNIYEKIKNIQKFKDLKKIVENIKVDVEHLSKEEVKERTKRSNNASSLREKINNNIELLEEYIIIGKLLG